MTQREAVIEAMRRRGGIATLGQLYIDAPRIEGQKWGTKTVNATIRKLVQNPKDFVRIKPGLWALKDGAHGLKPAEMRERLEEPESSHGYYQGLLVELGNMKEMQTYVPGQDKNRRFLNTPLSQIATLQRFHNFTYDHIVKQAKTIDVAWFNDRNLPHSFFEVERSTDIHRSLIKFVELQDFHTEFSIVADAHREREFKQKLQLSAFRPIQARVKFLSFERVADWYEKAAALSAVLI